MAYRSKVAVSAMCRRDPGRRGSSGKWCRVDHPSTNPTTLTDGVMGRWVEWCAVLGVITHRSRTMACKAFRGGVVMVGWPGVEQEGGKVVARQYLTGSPAE